PATPPGPAEPPSVGGGGGGGGGAGLINNGTTLNVRSNLVVRGGEGGEGIAYSAGPSGPAASFGGGSGGNAVMTNDGATIDVGGNMNLLGTAGNNTAHGGAGGSVYVYNTNTAFTVDGNMIVQGASSVYGTEHTGAGGGVIIDERGTSYNIAGNLDFIAGDGAPNNNSSAGVAGSVEWTGADTALNVGGNMVVRSGGAGNTGSQGGDARMNVDSVVLARGRTLTVANDPIGDLTDGQVEFRANELTTQNYRLQRGTRGPNQGDFLASVGRFHIDGTAFIELNNTDITEAIIEIIVFTSADRLTIDSTTNPGVMAHNRIEVSGTGSTYTGDFEFDMRGKEMAFDLSGVGANRIMLSVDSANYMVMDQSTDVSVSFTTRPPIRVGEQITLVHNVRGNYFDDSQVVSYGASDYHYLIELNQGVTDNNLKITLDRTTVVDDKAKSYFMGAMSRSAMIVQSSDLIINAGVPIAVGATATKPGCSKPAIFVALGGAYEKIHTGSNLRFRSGNMMLGAAFRRGDDKFGIVFAPFIEGGYGNYDSYNRYRGSELHADGDVHSYGAGVLARMIAGGFFLEGSVHGGKVKSDYASNDLGVGTASYDTSAWYYGAHAGLGYSSYYNECNKITYYAYGIYNQIGSDSATTNFDEQLNIDSTRSMRARVGVRHSHYFDDDSVVYFGGGWDHEFDNEMAGNINGGGVNNMPSMKGGSAMAEVGAKWYDIGGGWQLDLAARGMAGRRLGYSANVAFGKFF
ncbi:MAG: autotransporter outer membrane beta-barrel domain-containing protein, partial [Planctomycetes bacterium]|nr:autotransporter outer membrane beta-barrel domain-containing protein [Planctomycetota bacterium]